MSGNRAKDKTDEDERPKWASEVAEPRLSLTGTPTADRAAKTAGRAQKSVPPQSEATSERVDRHKQHRAAVELRCGCWPSWNREQGNCVRRQSCAERGLHGFLRRSRRTATDTHGKQVSVEWGAT